MSVEGEYCLSTNERRIQCEIAPEASTKSRATLLFTEPLPQPLGGVDDAPGIPHVGTPRSTCELPSPIFLDPRGFTLDYEAQSVRGSAR
jgi:hypothetical protein